MTNTVKILLKNGLMGLANLDEEYFKQNVTTAIALKLNENLKEIYLESNKNLLFSDKTTETNKLLEEFVNFVDNFKEGKYKFKNNSTLNITESQVDTVKKLFDSLSPNSRNIMVKEIFEDSQKFKEHIDFYNKIKGLVQ
jgi:hypothetical protein